MMRNLITTALAVAVAILLTLVLTAKHTSTSAVKKSSSTSRINHGTGCTYANYFCHSVGGK